MKLRTPLLIVAAVVIGVVANNFGLWWVGYLLGAALGTVVRPRTAGATVMLAWFIGLVIDASTTPLFRGAEVIAELAGFSSSAGPILLLLTLAIAYLEGWFPATLIYRLRTHHTTNSPAKREVRS
jgi:hypothetical protein